MFSFYRPSLGHYRLFANCISIKEQHTVLFITLSSPHFSRFRQFEAVLSCNITKQRWIVGNVLTVISPPPFCHYLRRSVCPPHVISSYFVLLRVILSLSPHTSSIGLFPATPNLHGPFIIWLSFSCSYQRLILHNYSTAPSAVARYTRSSADIVVQRGYFARSISSTSIHIIGKVGLPHFCATYSNASLVQPILLHPWCNLF